MEEARRWRVLRVNLTEEKTEPEEIEPEIQRRYGGGSGIGAKILYDETSATTDPLGPENRLIFMSGVFTGSMVPSSGRHSVVSKSPLTGIYGESDIGGSWGVALKRAGYDGVVVTGQSQDPVYILVAGDEVHIRRAEHVWGKDTYETDRLLRDETGKRAVVTCIGQAGERLSRIASIMSDGEHGRAAGRCGLGAVMGSKRLKAIVVSPPKKEQRTSDDRLKESVSSLLPQIQEKTKPLREFGTSGAFLAAEKLGDLPIKNWSLGSWQEQAQKISGQTMAGSILSGRYSCSNCVVGCGRVVTVREAPYGATSGGGPEYETLAAFGSMSLVDDLSAVVKANELSNRYGIDTISAGNILAFAMEAYEKGILKRKDLDGIDLSWGNAGAMLDLLRKIGEREGIGELLSQGVRISSETIGQGAEKFAMHVKGLELPMHDPRAYSSLAVAYATSRIGASHWAPTHLLEARQAFPDLGYPAILDRFEEKGKGMMTAKMQDHMEMFEALKICKFVSWIPLEYFFEWVDIITGTQTDAQEYRMSGERISNLKRMYNVRCGMTRKDDQLPERILTQKRGEGGAADHLPKLEAMLDEYYEYREWTQNGIPKKEKLKSLGMEGLAMELDSQPGKTVRGCGE